MTRIAQMVIALALTLCLCAAVDAGTVNPTGGGGGGGSGCTTSGASVLKGNGSGGCANAVSGTDVIVPASVGGDCSFTGPSTFICTKTNGASFAPSATTDTTNASNISSGTLAAARGGAGTVNGILKANGLGVVSGAAAGTDYQAPISGNTLATHNFATSINSSGTLSGAQPAFTDISGTATSAQLPTSGVTAGTYVSPTVAVDGTGRVTSAANGPWLWTKTWTYTGAVPVSTYIGVYACSREIDLPLNLTSTGVEPYKASATTWAISSPAAADTYTVVGTGASGSTLASIATIVLPTANSTAPTLTGTNQCATGQTAPCVACVAGGAIAIESPGAVSGENTVSFTLAGTQH